EHPQRNTTEIRRLEQQLEPIKDAAAHGLLVPSCTGCSKSRSGRLDLGRGTLDTVRADDSHEQHTRSHQQQVGWPQLPDEPLDQLWADEVTQGTACSDEGEQPLALFAREQIGHE